MRKILRKDFWFALSAKKIVVFVLRVFAYVYEIEVYWFRICLSAIMSFEICKSDTV